MTGFDAFHLCADADARAATLVGRFTFRVTNTDEGFADLLANEADIVMALREIRPDEVRDGARRRGWATCRTRTAAGCWRSTRWCRWWRRPTRVDEISLGDLSRIAAGELDQLAAISAGPTRRSCCICATPAPASAKASRIGFCGPPG